jgi:hypothetical protein
MQRFEDVMANGQVPMAKAQAQMLFLTVLRF